MTIQQAKKDALVRLLKAGAQCRKITAKSVSFQDLARGSAVFLTLHDGQYAGDGGQLEAAAFADVPKPSAGGYIVQFAPGWTWNKR